VRSLKNILVTGGAGFIGCNFIRFLFEKANDFLGRIVNLDALTYAGNLLSLEDIETRYGGGENARYFFERGDICDSATVKSLFKKYEIDTVVHFAAESHVDRSIAGPETFVKTNVMGTFTLLEQAKAAWKTADGGIRGDALFHHVSTDEVYGSLGESGAFCETTPYAPRSPYSASKAASDHLAAAYWHTFGVPVTISNCSNNYGPYQFPEKLNPLMLLKMLEKKPLPVYGDGKNVRDWLYVEDHCAAVWLVIKNGKTGEKYNAGGENEWQNIALLNTLISIMAKKTRLDAEKTKETIAYVNDRPGHDLRYAIDCAKIKRDLGWTQSVSFEEGLSRTVDWYLANSQWLQSIRTGEYRAWIEKNYGER
jgi:dTDP-glucose 4,6-dehydratase